MIIICIDILLERKFMNSALAMILIIVLCVIAIVVVFIVCKTSSNVNSLKSQMDDLTYKIGEQDSLYKERIQRLQDTLDKTEDKIAGLRQENSDQLEKIRSVTDEKLTNTLSQQSKELRDHLSKFDDRFANFQNQIQGFQKQIEGQLGTIRESVEKQLGDIRQDNEKQLDRMRETVDEKLSKTLESRLSSSFKQVSDQLENVHKGLGDMQNLATGVGDLKRVLSNVKTRGILGEAQLGAILSEILTHDQYLENVATKPESNDRVEFAIKIPQEDDNFILLPIDAKFPGETYEQLRAAIDDGDIDRIAKSRKALENRIKSEAKDIYNKYISVPETTNFAIMFLPFEGLYAEVVDQIGILGTLQRDYHITVAGPSTMSAILGSLQMTYQSIAIQKKADEIQQILSAIKAEFPKYQGELEKALKQIKTAGKTVDSIINTRTKAIQRKLKGVVAMEDAAQAERLLDISGEPIDVNCEQIKEMDEGE